MLIVGLTGNIAAGKSAVAAGLAAHGAPIIDADLLAREAVAPGSAALSAIVERFGPQMLTPDGDLDRAALRQVVFRDASARQTLNAIVHPEVARLRAAAVERLRASGARLVICDIPLLFEVGLDREMDRIILVDAPAELRRERLMRDRGLSASDADAMIAAQMPAAEKRPRAHYIIENDSSREALAAQVDALWKALNAAATA
ncbi:MAG: dephospho-CoA kinase [Gemmatimonas sp.]|nr:dephospho-CoA kinase [Gemmatimonas sp.]